MYIAVFGDSIAWGLEDKINGGWVSLLDKHLRAKGIGGIYNLAIDGDTSSGLLQRIEIELKPREIDKAIIAIGINDSLYRNNLNNVETPLEEFNSIINLIVKKVQMFTKNLVFVGLTKVDERYTKPLSFSETGKCYDNKLINQYNAKLKEICFSLKIPFIDVQDIIQEKDIEDGVHPNEVGHKKLYNKIKDELEKLKFI